MGRSLVFLAPMFLLAAGCSGRTPTPATSTADPSSSPASKQGRLTVVGGNGELGDADYGQRKTTTFTLRNDTSQPLNLFVADKNCQCAGLEIKPALVSPGQTTQAVVAWEPKLDQPTTEAVRVRATIQAEEDSAIRAALEAEGRIKPTLQISHPRGVLNFGRMLVADLKSGMKELGLEIYTEDPARKNFTLQARSLSPGLQVAAPQPLSADRLSVLKAIAGYRINIRPVEGLPIGAFREMVKLTSDVYPDRELDVMVDGILESGAVSLSREGIELPAKISLARGYICPPLEIELRGEPGRTLQIDKVEPKFLEVQLEPVAGKENTWRIHVLVPAGEAELRKNLSAEQLSEYTSYGFDSGAITLKSDHPRLPVLRIPVSGSQFQK